MTYYVRYYYSNNCSKCDCAVYESCKHSSCGSYDCNCSTSTSCSAIDTGGCSKTYSDPCGGVGYPGWKCSVKSCSTCYYSCPNSSCDCATCDSCWNY